jgi:ribonuclease Z
MEVIFLGTSEATPTAEKNQSAVLLIHNGEQILFDCGENTQRQFKIAKLNPCKITRILITHWHGDHILGLPGLIQTLALNNYSKTLKIYGPKGTKNFMSKILGMFMFVESIKTEIHEIEDNGPFLETENFTIAAYKMKHMAPCLAYSFVENDKRKINLAYIKKQGLKPGPLLGELQLGKDVRFKNKIIKAKQATQIRKGKKISFMLDTSVNENCVKVAKDANLLISEATFLEQEHADKAKERGHLTAKQAATIAKKAKVKKLILTHISQRYAKNNQVILQEAKKTFKNSELAKDFMKIVL